MLTLAYSLATMPALTLACGPTSTSVVQAQSILMEPITDANDIEPALATINHQCPKTLVLCLQNYDQTNIIHELLHRFSDNARLAVTSMTLAYGKLNSTLDVTPFSNLTDFIMCFNELEDSSALELRLPSSVQHLHLPHNKLTTMPLLTGEAKLKILDMHDNLLTQLPDVASCTCLQTLEVLRVHKNMLKQLPNIATLVHLKILDAGKNFIDKESASEKLTTLNNLHWARIGWEHKHDIISNAIE